MEHQVESEANSPSPVGGLGITAPMLLSLRQTRPWVKFISILGFISIGFMVIGGAINMMAFSRLSTENAPFPAFFFVIINVLMGVLYFFPSLFLYRFSSSIGRLLDGGGAGEMEEVLANQKSFWKYIGILTVVMFGFAILGIVAAIIVPMFVKMAGQ